MSIDLLAALIIVCALFAAGGIAALFRNRPPPHFVCSDISLLRQGAARRATWPRRLLQASCALLCLAFIDPHTFIPKSLMQDVGPGGFTPTEGIAIYLVIDQSGSMAEEIVTVDEQGRQRRLSKLELSKEVTKEFAGGNPHKGLNGRPNDLLGLVAFARTAQVLSPLTLDHKQILNQLEKLGIRKDRDQDGTAIGYALYKTINLIAATRHYAQEVAKDEGAYDITNSAIILITDGMQDPNPLDQNNQLRNVELLQAADYAVANNVKIYIINVEPELATPRFANYREAMGLLAQYTGGKFFTVDNHTSLRDIYADIDNIEKSAIAQNQPLDKNAMPDYYARFSYAPFILLVSLALFFAAVVTQTTIWRSAP